MNKTKNIDNVLRSIFDKTISYISLIHFSFDGCTMYYANCCRFLGGAGVFLNTFSDSELVRKK